ncbi:MAG: hypothetical protein Q9196_005294 [Gyalolechia fulgens]
MSAATLDWSKAPSQWLKGMLMKVLVITNEELSDMAAFIQEWMDREIPTWSLKERAQQDKAKEFANTILKPKYGTIFSRMASPDTPLGRDAAYGLVRFEVERSKKKRKGRTMVKQERSQLSTSPLMTAAAVPSLLSMPSPSPNDVAFSADGSTETVWIQVIIVGGSADENIKTQISLDAMCPPEAIVSNITTRQLISHASFDSLQHLLKEYEILGALIPFHAPPPRKRIVTGNGYLQETLRWMSSFGNGVGFYVADPANVSMIEQLLGNIAPTHSLTPIPDRSRHGSQASSVPLRPLATSSSQGLAAESIEAEGATKRKSDDISDDSLDDDPPGKSTGHPMFSRLNLSVINPRGKRRRNALALSPLISDEEDENAARGGAPKPAESLQDLSSEVHDPSTQLLQSASPSKPDSSYDSALDDPMKAHAVLLTDDYFIDADGEKAGLVDDEKDAMDPEQEFYDRYTLALTVSYFTFQLIMYCSLHSREIAKACEHSQDWDDAATFLHLEPEKVTDQTVIKIPGMRHKLWQYQWLAV